MNINNKKPNKRNWKKINYGKIKQIEILFDPSFLDTEKDRLENQNKNKIGRKFLYSNDLIKFDSFIKYYFRQDYRRNQALLTFFGKNMSLPVPYYTTMCRRHNRLELFLENISKENNRLHIAIDGTGFSVVNRGDWLRLIHRKGKIGSRKGFVRLVIAVDFDTKEIVAIRVLDDKTGENKVTKDLLEQTIKNKNQQIDKAYMDGAYDTYENLRCYMIWVFGL